MRDYYEMKYIGPSITINTDNTMYAWDHSININLAFKIF